TEVRLRLPVRDVHPPVLSVGGDGPVQPQGDEPRLGCEVLGRPGPQLVECLVSARADDKAVHQRYRPGEGVVGCRCHAVLCGDAVRCHGVLPPCRSLHWCAVTALTYSLLCRRCQVRVAAWTAAQTPERASVTPAPRAPGRNDMNAAFMLLQVHGWDIHAVTSGPAD